MTTTELQSLILSLFATEWTAALTLVAPLGIWIYRQRKQIAEIDTWDEVKLVGAPVLVVAAAGIAASEDWKTIVVASLVKLFVGLGMNSAPILPASKSTEGAK